MPLLRRAFLTHFRSCVKKCEQFHLILVFSITILHDFRVVVTFSPPGMFQGREHSFDGDFRERRVIFALLNRAHWSTKNPWP